MNKKLLHGLLFVALGLLIVHALYSNFVRVIGPNYIIRSAGYKRDYDTFCPTLPGMQECADVSCPLELTVVLPPPTKGFPFQTSDYDDVCNVITPYAASDFSLARALDIAYTTTITLFFAASCVWLIKKPSHK